LEVKFLLLKADFCGWNWFFVVESRFLYHKNYFMVVKLFFLGRRLNCCTNHMHFRIIKLVLWIWGRFACMTVDF
jgi:hypothetical protein